MSSGKLLHLKLIFSSKEQKKGLSGIKSMPANHGMLFFNTDTISRTFWMPDTYFNIDIIFLDKNLSVIHIERNVKAHPGFTEPPKIQRTRPITCRHVLEIKSQTEISKEIKKGHKFKWISPFSFSEIESKIHLLR